MRTSIKVIAFILILILVPIVFVYYFSLLPKMKFYGRIVDQNGNPVKEAKVWFEGNRIFLSTGGGYGRAKTDEQGYFVLNVRGASLTLGGITHPDIEYSYRRGALTETFVSYVDKHGEYDTWKNYTDKKHPYIIHTWRLGKYQGARKGQIIADLDASGKEYTLYLDQHDYRKKIKEGEHSDGHLYISCKRPHMKNTFDYGDWSLSVIPVNGGIQETNDIFLNEAPEIGYKSALLISEREGRSDYTHYLKQRYYFTLNNGEVYGSLNMFITPFGDRNKEACRIQIFSKINKTYSRNLELMPTVQ